MEYAIYKFIKIYKEETECPYDFIRYKDDAYKINLFILKMKLDP